jgi:hypothetical protein
MTDAKGGDFADAATSRVIAELRSVETTLEKLCAAADSRSALTSSAVRSSAAAGLEALRDVRSIVRSCPASPGDDQLLEELHVAEKTLDKLRVLADAKPLNGSFVGALSLRAIAALRFARALVEKRQGLPEVRP